MQIWNPVLLIVLMDLVYGCHLEELGQWHAVEALVNALRARLT
jgi:hypothetical protein